MSKKIIEEVTPISSLRSMSFREVLPHVTTFLLISHMLNFLRSHTRFRLPLILASCNFSLLWLTPEALMPDFKEEDLVASVINTSTEWIFVFEGGGTKTTLQLLSKQSGKKFEPLGLTCLE